MLVGPSGVGKTTLARIYAGARLCEKPQPSACGNCGNCRDGIQLYELRAAQFNSHAYAAQAARYGQTVPWGRFAIFIDEVHALPANSADALLASVEDPGSGAFYILATNEPRNVRPALMARCAVVNLYPLKDADAFNLLSDICGKERITFEPAALRMLVSLGRGSARELVKCLDLVANNGHLTAPLISKLLSMGWTTNLVAYFDALLAVDLAAQEEAINSWLDEPAAKSKAFREFLLYLHNWEIARPALSEIVNAAFYQINAIDRSRIVNGFRFRASRDGLLIENYWMDILKFWSNPEALGDEIGLRMHLRRFNALINPSAPSQTQTLPPAHTVNVPRRPPFRNRSRIVPNHIDHARDARTFAEAKSFLDLRQVEDIYTAATFLAQEYGLLFNAHLRIDHTALGRGDEVAAGKLVSDLTHQLGIRLKGWGTATDQFHWLYLHTRNASGLVTNLALHIPIKQGLRSEAWLKKRMIGWGGEELAAGTWSFQFDEAQSTQAPNSESSRAKRHWRIVRQLWSGLDPRLTYATQNGRALLVDLLKIPKSERRPAGILKEIARWGTSRELGPAARGHAEAANMPLLSAFRDLAWEHLATGWELREHRDRLDERRRRKEAEDLAAAEWPGEDDLQTRRRCEALQRVLDSYPCDPHARRRTWSGWWGENTDFVQNIGNNSSK